MTTIVYFNGAFLPKEHVTISPDDRGFLFADGVYDVVLSYGGRCFRKEAHLERLANGLRALRITGVDMTALSSATDELLERNGVASADTVVYIQVTRGAAPRKHAFPPGDVEPTVYATVTPFVRKGDPVKGVAVITVPDTRWARCDIKTVGLLSNCLANQEAQEAGAHEAIFVRDGVVLEGTATSFFAVFDGVVRTAPKSNYILPGITRAFVLELCARNGISAREEPIFLHELLQADEMFLVGTTTEIVPIVKLDGQAVGDGRPGSVARQLYELFLAETRGSTIGTAPVPST